ncbi:hypothetical protein CPB85DRAFT_1563484 [Mucidula mucida]|nr:hypothetical protein CPB85DRAFT_1563484 [Mucidula mucida]
MSTSDDQLSSSPKGLLPSRTVIASGNFPPGSSTASTWKDVEQALSIPICLPSAVQPLLAILQDLLLTNNPPSSQDFTVVSECVCLLDDLIAKSDAAIALTFTPYDQIPGKQTALRNEQKTKRAKLQHLRKRVDSVISVIRRLPQEIWQEIFFFVCSSDHNGNLNVFHLRDPLYVVNQVCRTWRTTSHHHPRLWSQIVIETSRVRSRRESLLRLGMVLERARSVPLDFKFFSRSESPGLSVALLSLLTEYSHQWRSAEVHWLTPNEARPLELIRGRVPELQELNVSFTRGGEDVKPTDLISAFQSAPKLLQVGLHHFPLDQVLLDASVKQNLQCLAITYPDKEEDTDLVPVPSLFEIISGYPSLKALRLSRSWKSDAGAWPAPCAPRTVYAGLRSLRAVEGDSLNRISLPSLINLAVGINSEVLTPGILPCLISLLRHSRCHLKILGFCSVAWDEESLDVLLALVPDLIGLTVSFWGTQDVDDALRVLTRCLSAAIDDGPKSVPQLKRLSIHLSFMAAQSKETFIDKEFLDMLSMRADHGFKVVHFSGMHWGIGTVPVLKGADLRQWRKLEKDGLIHMHQPRY